MSILLFGGVPGNPAGKESACNAGDPSLIPGLGRSTGEGISYPFQYSWGSAGKESSCNAGVSSLIPGLGRSPGEGIGYPHQYPWASMVAQLVGSACNVGRPGFDPWVEKIPWRRAWQTTPVFLPGETHGQRSLVGYSP